MEGEEAGSGIGWRTAAQSFGRKEVRGEQIFVFKDVSYSEDEFFQPKLVYERE
jgi:hypothetical protein